MWLLYVFVGLLAFALFVVVIGSGLPARSEGRIAARIDRDLEAVWEALQDVDAHPMTGKAKRGIEHLPSEDGLPAWREDMGHGEVITVRTTEFDPPRRMVRSMEAKAVKMSSVWTYRLEPDGDGTRIELEGETEIRRGTWHTPVFRLMMRLGGGVRAGLKIQLEMVARTLGTRLVEQG